METIRVNMTPCEDIKTIHASQNDNEAREWGFELHNNGEKIDSSSISDQLVFKAYEGGTEEILPTNGSTPTTSPFKGDIRYPQGILSDQEFLYRESPTEEDGLAKITDIKGNTLVWNQIFIPYGRTGSGIQSNVIQDGNDYSMRIYGTATASAWLRMDSIGVLPVGHKFLLDKGSTSNLFDINNDNNGLNVDFSVKTKIGTVTTANKYIYIFVGSGTTIDVTVKPMLIDLTAMFGAGNEPTSVEEFTSLFSLPYYAYNQGTLLSFNGNGIKTTGKNLLPNSEYTTNASGTTSKTINVDGFPVGTAILSCEAEDGTTVNWQNAQLQFRSGSTSILDRAPNLGSFTLPSIGSYDNILLYTTNALANKKLKWQLEYGSVATSYEPYTSSTLSLPISTYFPNGMDGVGTDYDELTNTKATTRMTRVDLGSLDWNYNPTYGMYSTGISNSVKKPSASSVRANAISTVGTFTDWATFYASGTTSGLLAINTSGYIGIATTETNSTTFKNSLQGVYLVYPLATPTEVTFSTASLVTENAEIPLSNEDGVLIGKCTEELSSESGFFDAKIKLADEDGECYSNKIQLHIERSPQ